jgi:uncharacterized protein (TIGR03067 family)
MRYAILLAAGLVVSQAPEAPPKLDGEWQCVHLSIDGEKVPRKVAEKVWLVVDGKSWKEEARGKEMQRFDIQLRPNGVIRFDVPGKNVGFLGRYEIKGNRLKVCYPGPLEVGKPPQAPEKIEPGPKVTVAEWERVD